MHGDHNHDDHMAERHRAFAVQECETLAGDPQWRRKGPSEIVAEARRLHPNAIIACNPALEKRIQRAKRQRQPPSPETPQEMVDSMRHHPEYS